MGENDVIIIGAGIAGASAGYFISQTRKVVLIERESQPGYHSTGRSAALFTESYGNASMRTLTTASRRFFEAPPTGFGETPLLRARGLLYIGRADQRRSLERLYEDVSGLTPGVRMISAAEAMDLCPILRADHVATAMREPDCMDIDVGALHQGYLKGLRKNGGEIITDAEVVTLGPGAGGLWRVETRSGRFVAPVVVNAAGAWADEVAALAGVRPAGLTPKRRTVALLDPPAGVDPAGWPMVVGAEEDFYFKPESGRLLLSPADETPSPPCDAQPEDIDVAVAVDRLQQATTLQVRHVARKWAGLRTFAVDKTIVAGFDAEAPGFFWLAGQGGYGIQTSPSMGRIAAALIAGQKMPPDIGQCGIDPDALGVGRLRR